MAPWTRYDRTLDGAWHAIDDLRDTLEVMNAQVRFWSRLVGLALSGSGVAVAVHVWLG